MNRLLLAALAALVGLIAVPFAASAASPNTGKVVQIQQAGSYTYAEVETENGQRVWMAGNPIAVKPGDAVQWGDYSVMQNFSSRTLGRTFDKILFVNSWGPAGAPDLGGSGQGAAGANQGEVKSVVAAGGYSYLEVNQGSGTVWVAVPETTVKAGDKVRWDGATTMRNFTAKSLNRTFDQIIFASGVSVVR